MAQVQEKCSSPYEDRSFERDLQALRVLIKLDLNRTYWY